MTSSSKTVIVGAGLMGYWHAYYLRQSGRRVSAIIDPNRDRALAVGRRFAISTRCTSTRNCRVPGSIWHICTPSASHYELIGQALAAGAHVLVEKPLCATADEAGEVLAAASNKGLLLCPAHHFLWQKGTLKVFRYLSSLGNVRHFRMNVFTAGATDQDPAGKETTLDEILPHPLAVLVRLAGVDADYSLIPAYMTPETMLITGSAGTISAEIHLSASGRPTRCEAEITGTRASARLNFFHGFGVFDEGAVSRRHKITQPLAQSFRTQWAALSNLAYRGIAREPAYPGLRELIRRFHVAVEKHGAAPIPADEVLRVSQLRDALHRRNGAEL